MKPIKLTNVFAFTKNQMLPINARLKTRTPFRPTSSKYKGLLPKKIQEINKES
jgi:hypothetical protein